MTLRRLLLLICVAALVFSVRNQAITAVGTGGSFLKTRPSSGVSSNALQSKVRLPTVSYGSRYAEIFRDTSLRKGQVIQRGVLASDQCVFTPALLRVKGKKGRSRTVKLLVNSNCERIVSDLTETAAESRSALIEKSRLQRTKFPDPQFINSIWNKTFGDKTSIRLVTWNSTNQFLTTCEEDDFTTYNHSQSHVMAGTTPISELHVDLCFYHDNDGAEWLDGQVDAAPDNYMFYDQYPGSASMSTGGGEVAYTEGFDDVYSYVNGLVGHPYAKVWGDETGGTGCDYSLESANIGGGYSVEHTCTLP